MAAKQERKAAKDGRGSAERPHLVSFLLLAGAILGVLLLGAALRTTEPEADVAELGIDRPTLDLATPTAPMPEGVEEPRDFLPPESMLDRMARRAGADVARLAVEPAGWTAQVGVFCDPVRVHELVEAFAGAPALLVLPSYHGERPCFRICWNRYRTRESASSADDMPSSLRALLEGEPYPRRVTEVLE